VTPALERLVVQEPMKNPRITSKAILSKAGTNISRQTHQWTLHKAGLH